LNAQQTGCLRRLRRASVANGIAFSNHRYSGARCVRGAGISFGFLKEKQEKTGCPPKLHAGGAGMTKGSNGKTVSKNRSAHAAPSWWFCARNARNLLLALSLWR